MDFGSNLPPFWDSSWGPKSLCPSVRVQNQCKRLPRGSKSVPRGSKSAPRVAQERPKGLPERPKRVQVMHRTAPRAPKSSQDRKIKVAPYKNTGKFEKTSKMDENIKIAKSCQYGFKKHICKASDFGREFNLPLTSTLKNNCCSSSATSVLQMK